MRAKRVVACLAVIGIVLAALPGEAAELKKLRVTIPVASLTFYPIYVAQDKGFFKDEGYEFEIVVTQGDGPDVDALLAGSVQFTSTPPHRALAAYEQGKRLLLVANLMNRVGINCFMNKEVADSLGITEKTPLAEKIKKLKGLTMGATRPGAFTYQLAIHYTKRGGYEPQRDVKIIGAGGGPSMMAAVENRKVDIGCISSPAPEQSVFRGKSIMWVNNTTGEDPEFSEFLFETLYVLPEYAKEHPGIVKGVVKALVRAMHYIVEGPEDDHLRLLKARFSGVDDQPLLESLKNLRAALRPDGVITKASMDANVKFLKESGLLKTDVPWDAVATNEFLPKQ